MRLSPLFGHTSLLALAACLAISASPARAAYTVTFSEVGPNVLASGSGSIDLSGLTFVTSGHTLPEIAPTFGTEVAGLAGAVDEYSGTRGPTGFGIGVFTSATIGTGDLVAIQQLIGPPVGFVDVPMGYTSGAPLSDTATYDNQSFATLGLTPATYEWTWGSSAADDTFTLVAAVPEPASLTLLGTVVGLGLLVRRRRRLRNLGIEALAGRARVQ